MGDEFVRFGRTWDPWRELYRLQDEVNRLFTGMRPGVAAGAPAVNVWTSDEGALLKAELPGIDPKAIDISVLGDSVTLTGRRELEGAGKEVTYHRREREHGEFTRTLQLPFRIEAEQVKAHFEDGVLELTLPRANADRPKKIAVKAD